MAIIYAIKSNIGAISENENTTAAPITKNILVIEPALTAVPSPIEDLDYPKFVDDLKDSEIDDTDKSVIPEPPRFKPDLVEAPTSLENSDAQALLAVADFSPALLKWPSESRWPPRGSYTVAAFFDGAFFRDRWRLRGGTTTAVHRPGQACVL